MAGSGAAKAYDFLTDDNVSKWKGVLQPALRKVRATYVNAWLHRGWLFYTHVSGCPRLVCYDTFVVVEVQV